MTRLDAGFGNFLALARVMVLVPVVMLVLAAAGVFAYATVVFFVSMPGLSGQPVPVGHKPGLVLAENPDVDVLYLGVAVALVIGALIPLLRFGSDSDHGSSSPPAP